MAEKGLRRAASAAAGDPGAEAPRSNDDARRWRRREDPAPAPMMRAAAAAAAMDLTRLLIRRRTGKSPAPSPTAVAAARPWRAMESKAGSILDCGTGEAGCQDEGRKRALRNMRSKAGGRGIGPRMESFWGAHQHNRGLRLPLALRRNSLGDAPPRLRPRRRLEKPRRLRCLPTQRERQRGARQRPRRARRGCTTPRRADGGASSCRVRLRVRSRGADSRHHPLQ